MYDNTLYVFSIFLIIQISTSDPMCIYTCTILNISIPKYASKSPFPELMCLFNPFTNKPWFLRVCSTSLLKTLREKENCSKRLRQFLFSHSIFKPYGKPSAIFIKFEIVVCKLFELGRV